MRLLLQTVFAMISVTVATPSWAGADEGTAYFESRIRPVLVEHCYKCHSGQTKSPKGGLRLDSREALLRGGENGPAIVPGKPDASLVIKALSYSGEVAEMPPDEKLPDRVLTDFRRWIASGAPDPRNEGPEVTPLAGGAVASDRDAWAFRPPRYHGAPSVRETSWARDELDRFILATLETKELRPAPDADRYTWLRRVALDLVGVPPSPGQIVAFVNDPSPQAKERVVDRLLASPAFGERWARHWLDLTATPTRSARPTTSSPSTPGDIAIMSSTHSTPTNRSTVSSASSSAATCFPTVPPSSEPGTSSQPASSCWAI